MARLARDIGDSRVLRLVLSFLKAGWYRMSVSPQTAEAMSNKWFAEIGLIPLVSPIGRNRVVP